MKKPSEADRAALRMNIMGLGEDSYRKSYYPELQAKISELERFKSLLDQANDMIFLLEVPGGHIVYSSLSCSRLLSYSGSELLEMTVLDLLPTAAPDSLLRFLEEADRRTEQESRVTTVFIAGDRRTIPVEITIRLVPSDGLLFAVLVARDVTERVQTEEILRKSHDELERRVEERTAELKTYMAELERSNQALQEFSFVASHDLQEPLRKIRSFGLRLKKYTEMLPPEASDYLSRMLNAGDRMQALIQSLLTYSRVTTRKEPFTPVDLNEVLKRVIEDLVVRIETEGGAVQVEDLPTIKADPAQMHQLFQNLIGNALKYHGEERPVIRVYCNGLENGFCRIYVQDNGIGFDEKYLDRIFAPFQRLHGRGRFEGTGMGLAISRRIVERHNGSITARSSPGNGSTFIITLPLNPPENQ